jgi:hypothetical protein
MKRLYDNDLIYGRLLKISQPHLIERYNKALKAFALPATKLESFEIDKTGFSPQVADELGDPDYLDPNGVNRRFIILTPSQSTLPVVHTQFSNTEALMYEFFTSNARAINALTIKDVIYGEIEDNVATVQDIEDLLSIQQVEFNVLSADDVLGKAAELRTLVDRLKSEPQAWRDDAMLEPHGRSRQDRGRHPREHAGARSGGVPARRVLGQPFRRLLRLRRRQDDDGDRRSRQRRVSAGRGHGRSPIFRSRTWRGSIPFLPRPGGSIRRGPPGWSRRVSSSTAPRWRSAACYGRPNRTQI